MLKTEVCDVLGISYPIIQAGMAGGVTTVDLVVSVSNAGGLGTLGAAYMLPEQIRKAVREIKARTEKPFAVNLFCTEMTDDFSGVDKTQKVLNVIRENLKIAQPKNVLSTQNLFNEQFDVLIEEEVPIISTAFGLLPNDKAKRAEKNNIKVMTMVTSVREAILAEKSGVDVIIAQGSDAGGHRGTWKVEKGTDGSMIGTFSLIPQVVDAVAVPVVAAGGIMDSRGIVAALALGAKGVQMGTAFLTCLESGAHPVYKKALLESDEESTVITHVFSGRPARGIKNDFINTYDKFNIPRLNFPTQNTLTSDIRKESARQNNPEYMSLWAGQATRLLQKEVSVGLFIKKLVEEVERF